MVKPSLILASGSPRRRELLAHLGLAFNVVLPTVDEKDLLLPESTLPADRVAALAQYKGASVAQLYPSALVIAADTIVVLENTVLEKPADRQEAFAMLSQLQGQTHTVYTAIGVFAAGTQVVEAMATHVRMRAMTESEIWAYIDTHEPMDKAGAYAIQGVGSTLIERIDGCYFNVVGMSLVQLDRLCRAVGHPLVLSDTALAVHKGA